MKIFYENFQIAAAPQNGFTVKMNIEIVPSLSSRQNENSKIHLQICYKFLVTNNHSMQIMIIEMKIKFYYLRFKMKKYGERKKKKFFFNFFFYLASLLICKYVKTGSSHHVLPYNITHTQNDTIFHIFSIIIRLC